MNPSRSIEDHDALAEDLVEPAHEVVTGA